MTTKQPRPLTLTVISYPRVMNTLFEQAALHFARAVGPDFALERCQDPGDLVFLARRWKNRGRRIVRLDLHGHGDAGRFQLGDDLLFSSDGTGYGLARRLGSALAPDGELRLLGCRVAQERHPRDPLRFSGRRLLRDLQGLLGRQRRVLAGADYLGSRHWGEKGLNHTGEALLAPATRGSLEEAR